MCGEIDETESTEDKNAHRTVNDADATNNATGPSASASLHRLSSSKLGQIRQSVTITIGRISSTGFIRINLATAKQQQKTTGLVSAVSLCLLPLGDEPCQWR